MELRGLKYFLMVAREENISKAAALQLEDELGVKLFHRSRHSIILTEEGMLLKRRAQEIVSLSDKTLLELSRKDEIVTGEIAIGGGETKACFFWRNG